MPVQIRFLSPPPSSFFLLTRFATVSYSFQRYSSFPARDTASGYSLPSVASLTVLVVKCLHITLLVTHTKPQLTNIRSSLQPPPFRMKFHQFASILLTLTLSTLTNALSPVGTACTVDSECETRLCNSPYTGPGGRQCISRPAPNTARCDKSLEATDCDRYVETRGTS